MSRSTTTQRRRPTGRQRAAVFALLGLTHVLGLLCALIYFSNMSSAVRVLLISSIVVFFIAFCVVWAPRELERHWRGAARGVSE